MKHLDRDETTQELIVELLSTTSLGPIVKLGVSNVELGKANIVPRTSPRLSNKNGVEKFNLQESVELASKHLDSVKSVLPIEDSTNGGQDYIYSDEDDDYLSDDNGSLNEDDDSLDDNEHLEKDATQYLRIYLDCELTRRGINILDQST